MNIKIRLQLTILTVLCAGGIISLTVFMASRQMDANLVKVSLYAGLVRKISALDALKTDYLINPRERAHQQWQATYNSLGVLLKAIQPEDSTEESPVASLIQHYQELSQPPFQLLTTQATSIESNSFQQDLQKKLVRLLSVKFAIMFDEASRLVEERQKKIVASRRLANRAAMTVVVAMLALGVSALLLTSHRITRSIQKLHEGTILISHGNLNRRVEIKGADEIAKLAEAFNAMAQHLELDIAERKRAEEQLKSSYEQLRALSARIQSIREEERTTIAREIHDELGQALTGLKMDLSWLRKKIPEEELIEKTQSMLKLIDSTIQTVRKISTELRPGILDDLGLIAAIEWQAGDFQSRTGIKCEFNSSLEEVALEREVSTAIFRIVQETLTNVVRHANATQVNIKVGEEDGILLVEIEDNGRGITGKEISSPKSLGLLGMRERAHLFGGELEIKGTSGERTVVMVRIPLRTKDDRRNTKLIRHLS